MSVHSLFVVAPRGIIGLLAEELTDLGARRVREEPAGCRVRGPLSFAYRICLWSRLANRVLLHLEDLRAPDADALYEGVRAIAWEDHLGPESTLAVDFVGRGAGVTDTRFGAQRIKDAIVDRFRDRDGRRPSVDTTAPDVRIHAFARGSGCSVSIDLAGDSLHRRGWRAQQGPAPLKENVAAALLRFGGWAALARDGATLVDPMAGAGTIAIEAAMIACDRAPALERARFGFSRWRGHEADRWQPLLDEARQRAHDGRAAFGGAIVATDSDPRSIELARGNATRAAMADLVRCEHRALDRWSRDDVPVSGLVATNPPHGERLLAKASARELHLALGRTLTRAFAGWRAVVLTTDDELRHAIGLTVAESLPVDNGPVACVVQRIDVPTTDTPSATPSEIAVPFVHRLRKNLARLRPWAKAEAIACYRLYDAEIPEFNVAIDRYAEASGSDVHVLVQEFQAPARVDPELAAARLQAVLTALPEELGVPPEAIHLVRRVRQRGGSQYQPRGATRRKFVVQEGGLQFWVNLDDYLDTGLFLHHRRTRAMIRAAASGRRFANLFSYTGTATVYAAAGGARTTTSVDLSNTYLDWARENLVLNRLDGPQHHMIRADARRFLADTRERFDLMFLDPPTYSRSKAMTGDLDIQRDHAALIDAAMSRLDPSGELVFSTNARRFSLDPAIAERYTLEDLTEATLPRDFRRTPPIHRLWRLRPRKH